jgi:putative (di)nucleoside polyphosphate hydrolase
VNQDMKQGTSLPYRFGVGIMLLNRQNLVFTGQRIDTVAEAWQMPQGGIDDEEEPAHAALRELQEETGVTSVEILKESKDWYYYDLPEDLIKKIWKGKYRGQKQKWYLIRFLGEEQEINLEGKHPEFLAYRWVPVEKLPALAVPFKRMLYQQLIEEFSPLLSQKVT